MLAERKTTTRQEHALTTGGWEAKRGVRVLERHSVYHGGAVDAVVELKNILFHNGADGEVLYHAEVAFHHNEKSGSAEPNHEFDIES